MPDLTMLNAVLPTVAAPWVLALQLKLVDARDGAVTMSLPVAPALVHGGGVLCGQALMAAADTAMILAVVTRLGEFRPMTTVQLQTSFLRAVPAEAIEVRIDAEVLRFGRKLVFGQVRMATPDGELAAHATTTYALL